MEVGRWSLRSPRGTVSEITGGKFANGALSAAFVALATGAVQRANADRPDYGAMSDQEIKAFFENMAGTSYEDIENRYYARTGERLTPAQLRQALTDRSYVKSMGDKFNVQFRKVMAKFVPDTLEAALAAGYRKMGFFESLFHDPINNVKLVGPYGHMEAVYSRSGSFLIDTGPHVGTFNFFSPVNPAGHISADIVPHFR